VTGPPRVAVAIVGAGPVGVTAANLLGVYGISTLVVDREPDVVEYPRAVGIDDESLRTFQATGLAAGILRQTIQNVPLKLIDAAGRCLADIRPSSREYGWYRRNIFMQPEAERLLRRGLERFDHVRMELGTTADELRQDEDGVSLRLTGADGRTREVRADYVIAAVGAAAPGRNSASRSRARRTAASGSSSTARTTRSTPRTPHCTATRAGRTCAPTCRTTTAGGSSCSSPARTPTRCSPPSTSPNCCATTSTTPPASR
jgi:2-polyprenyl-6-methoxyphenol hydroxylase-like FAD-dependent oxidoreductase